MDYFQTPAALERMEEMRQLISQRQGEGTPRNRPSSMASDTPAQASGSNRTEDIHRSLTTLVNEADSGLIRASSNHEALENGIQQLAEDFQDVRLIIVICIRRASSPVWLTEISGARKDAT
jgi:hypothetical protein